jgi:hypothetical protein
MVKVTLFLVAAATLVGCASTRRETAAAIQRELPQLVDACNGAFRDGREQGLGIVALSQGIDACDRLALARSLDLVRPATAELYKSYRADKTYRAANRAAEADARSKFPAGVCIASAPIDCSGF